jgi:carbamoyltransferase
MYVLGINSVYHEPSACLLKDGILVAAAEEERFTGFRHGKEANPYNSWILPFNAINYCLEKENISINEIDHIAYSFNPKKRFLKRMPPLLLKFKINKIKDESFLFYFNSNIKHFLRLYPPKCQRIRKRFIGSNKSKVHFIDHHLSHAASSFFVSPFREAAILSVDGIGEVTSTFLGYGKNNKIKKIKNIAYPNSLGFFYEEITEFLGFQRNHDEYKVMALAAYGKPKYYKQLSKLIQLKNNGDYEIKIDFEKNILFGCRELKNVLGKPRLWGSPLTQRHKDIAASAQKILGYTVLHVLNWLYHKTKSENLCLAGGVVLNCLMNSKIRDNTKFKRIFIQPAANDAGTSIGAAFFVYNSILNNKRSFVLKNVYLGPTYPNEEIRKKLLENKIHYKKYDNISKKCADLLSKGKIIAWFQGGMEFGPRALGNRSILADPRKRLMKNKLNRIKSREEFRPLAPVIKEEKLREYFTNSTKSPFMLFTYRAKKGVDKIIPSALHIDKSARVQTVNETDNPQLYSLLNEFEKITKIPILINTSFNYKGKPIVCTIEQALDCFYNSGIDYLAIGNFLISKSEENESRISK